MSAQSTDNQQGFDRGLLAGYRFDELFPPALFPDGFDRNYDEEDISKCLDDLGSMSQSEFNKLKERREANEFPPDPFLMMWAISARMKNDDQTVTGPDGKPAWPRDMVLKYMDDQSGHQHSALSLEEEVRDLACTTMVAAAQHQVIDQVLDMAAETAEAMGHHGAAAAIKVGKQVITYRENIKHVSETFGKGRDVFKEMDGYVSDERRPNEPWKECPPDNPFHVFAALSPKPTDWKKIDLGRVALSRRTEIAVSQCSLEQQVAAMRDPSQAKAIAEQHAQKPLGAQMIAVVKKAKDQLLRIVHLDHRGLTHLNAANDPNRNQRQQGPAVSLMARTLSGAAARCGMGNSSPFGAPKPQPLPQPSDPDPLRRRRNP